MSEAMAYIGLAECGCILWASVDEPDMAKDNAAKAQEIIASGGHIEHVTCDYVRQNMRSCPHQRSSN